jgi:hypothetical protein
MENKQQELIEKIKQQSVELWETIEEARVNKLNIYLDFGCERSKPEIVITEVLFSQGQY